MSGKDPSYRAESWEGLVQPGEEPLFRRPQKGTLKVTHKTQVTQGSRNIKTEADQRKPT